MRVSDLSIGMISYCVGIEHVFALLLDDEGNVQRFQLARCAEVFPRIDALMNALRNPLGLTPSRRAEEVRQFALGWGSSLLPPIDVLKRFDILLVVPHHFLHGVPMHLVHLDGQPLATTHGISYCSSATLLYRCFERNKARTFDPRAWNFPLHDDDTLPEGPAIRTCNSCGVDILTGKNEAYRKLAEIFASHFPEMNLGFCRNEIKSSLSPAHRRTPGALPAIVEPDVICLVSHGHIDTIQIERSGLLLLGTPGLVSMQNILVHGDITLRVRDHPFAEIPLRLEPEQPITDSSMYLEPEIMTTSELAVQCECDAQLVALFGCSTGSGIIGSNDDYLCLATQWLKIGAASVIANQWEADLEVLGEWSHRFVEHWKQLRQPKAIAWREATCALLADRPDWTDQLDLWGCIALFGDWL